MKALDREKILYRICCPYLFETIQGIQLKFFEPTVVQRNVANRIYDEWFAVGIRNGLMTEEEHLDFLISNDLWDSISEEQVDGIQKDIDKLKIGLCEMYFRSKERITIKNNILSAKDKLNKLLSRKHGYDFVTADYLARLSKNTFLLFCEIYDSNDNLFVDPNTIFTASTPLYDEISNFRLSSQMDESIIREIARTEPWRTNWMMCKKPEVLFGTDILRLHANQQYLIMWSKIYDNARESMDCPADDIINDDDALDGWFLIQKQKIDKERGQNQLDNSIGNEKIRNAQEVFIMADTPEDARKIYDMNDLSARSLIKQREEFIM